MRVDVHGGVAAKQMREESAEEREAHQMAMEEAKHAYETKFDKMRNEIERLRIVEATASGSQGMIT